MDKLTELAVKFSCDKLYTHSYIETGFYADQLAKVDVRRLLEIGIGFESMIRPLVPRYVHGASLKMWEEYFPQANIFSCDILPETLVNEGLISSVVCDQYDAGDLIRMAKGFGGNFDVIIDDGCHHPLAQVTSFYTLWPYLADGGIYIIEDVGYPELLSKAIAGSEVHIFRKNSRWDDVAVTKRKITVE